MADRDAQDQPDPHDDDTGKPPHLDESVRRIGAAGRATIDSALDTGRALRRLVSADLALARSAMGRALAWVAVAIVFGASAWLLVMGVLTALLHSLGLSWLAAFAICAALSLGVTGFAAWRVSVFFEYAGMHATRRQLARFGIGDEDADDEDDPPATAPQAGAP
ncbi:phage holin family protein [Luteimonas sp. 22616]|uniref:phage holin family protein n=1 Tax=Luteimonas sp. 22616 TaxID=3453951 RepID=UPI003F87CE27